MLAAAATRIAAALTDRLGFKRNNDSRASQGYSGRKAYAQCHWNVSGWLDAPRLPSGWVAEAVRVPLIVGGTRHEYETVPPPHP